MRINELLGIKYPVFQGGMANISDGAFAAAISEAGALGIIGAGGMNAEALAEQIKICKERTDKPFGVNIMLMNPDADRMAEIAADEGVAVITTGAGNPGKYMKMWNDAGIKVFPVVSGVALARRLEDSGAFGIIAEGCESGGHIGELTTMALVPQVVDAVKIPVIAAGGIASGRQMAAAFALGACGVHENYKEAVIAARDTGTAVTGRSAGAPVRVLKNAMVREYLKLEKEGADLMELEKFTLGSLRRAVKDGDTKTGSVMAGQVSGMLK